MASPLANLFRRDRRASILTAGAGYTAPLSPYAGDTLSPAVIMSEWLGTDQANALPLTRLEALRVPAVAKLRNVLVATVGPLPLRVLDAAGPVAEQPRWTSATDTNETPYGRTAEIVADLLFEGYSVLAVQRDTDGIVTQIAHIPQARLGTDAKKRLTVDGQTVSDREVIIVNSPYEGLLAIGSPTIRGARDLELAWHGRSRNPIPLVVISHNNQDTQSGGLEPDEIQALVDGYSDRRRDPNGAVGYLPPGLKIDVFGTAETDLFEKGRNAATTSIGQLANVRASMLDGTLADSSSLTYVTKEGERSSFITFDLPFFTRPIEERLSADDVVAPGSRVRFDLSDLISNPQTPTGAPTDD